MIIGDRDQCHLVTWRATYAMLYLTLRPKVFSTKRRTAGVLVAPPTSRMWSNGRPPLQKGH